MERRSSGDWFGSYRGPPGAAAWMWAATPMLDEPSGVESGAMVRARQAGFEQVKQAVEIVAFGFRATMVVAALA